MKATIITIGDEILIGQIVDTNSVSIARHLNAAGIVVHEKVSIGDAQRADRRVRGTRPRPVGHRNHHRRTRPHQGRHHQKDAGRNVRQRTHPEPSRLRPCKTDARRAGHRIQRTQPRPSHGSGLLHGAVQRARHGAGHVVRTRRQSGRLAAGRTLPKWSI